LQARFEYRLHPDDPWIRVEAYRLDNEDGERVWCTIDGGGTVIVWRSPSTEWRAQGWTT